jgi:hypothetical protein
LAAVIILHGNPDTDWATALSNELKEHSPVRYQIGATAPQIQFGPSIIRVALWSDESDAAGLGETMRSLIALGPRHSVLIRRGQCAALVGADVLPSSENLVVSDVRECASLLRPAIERLASSVAIIAINAEEVAEKRRRRLLRLLDTSLLALVLGGLGVAAYIYDWGGSRSQIHRSVDAWFSPQPTTSP